MRLILPLDMQLKKQALSFLLWLCTATAAFPQVATASGTILNYCGGPVAGVPVFANLFDTAVTDANGYYELQAPLGSSFEVLPYLNSFTLHGVNQVDLELMRLHMLGIGQLNSPYKIIAADVNRSNSVTTFDLVEITKVMDGLSQTFTNNTSWRFIPASFNFPDPSNPFSTAFPGGATVNFLSNDLTDVNFVAVKVGDVDGTCPQSVDADSTAYGSIQGEVFFDENDDCILNSSEGGLHGWLVSATDGNNTYLGFTRDDGSYNMYVPLGTFEVTVSLPNGLWQPCQNPVQNVQVAAGAPAFVNFPVQALSDCPYMEVNLTTAVLRRCFEGYYVVSYCNNGTATGEDTRIEITFDSFLTVTASSLPWASVNGNTYTFEPGDVPPGQCGFFNVTVGVSCEATLGQTHCSTAQIFPNTNCMDAAGWDGSMLQVSAECLDDEVIFTITNTGEDMEEAVEYVVIEDVMIRMTNDLQLNSNETHTVPVPKNGATWRLEIQQTGGNPLAVFEAATLEGCSFDTVFSTGYVNLFPLGDAEPFEDTDCEENVGSYDPNDKTGLPLGVTDEHFIEPNQPIEYQIRFQNTGTDTAFTVMVRDSLSPLFDAATFRLLGASHPVEYYAGGNGEFLFIFHGIALPDSFINEPASHGWVKFSVLPKADLLLGTQLENEAAIYFDFNDPVITNRTLHTIEEGYLNISLLPLATTGVHLKATPNPFAGETTIEIMGSPIHHGVYRLFDATGRIILRDSFTGNSFVFRQDNLRAGLYFLLIENDGRPVGTGKLMVGK